MRRALIALAAATLALGACSSGGSDDVSAPDGDETTTTDAPEQIETSAVVGEESDPSEADASDSESDTETSDSDTSDSDSSTGELFPDVVDATATRSDDGTWTIAATLSSPYDSPERYADAWQVLGPDGTQYGERFLTHDHANEQPFTRSESGIEIPDSVDVVTIQGRDQVSGWGGETFELTLER